MNLLRLSLNLLRRDWRAGEWRVRAAGGGQPLHCWVVRRPRAAGVAAGGAEPDQGGYAHHFCAPPSVGLSHRGAGARVADGDEPVFSEHGGVWRGKPAERDTAGRGGLYAARQDHD